MTTAEDVHKDWALALRENVVVRLHAAGIAAHSVRVEPSAVTYSPHWYVYVYLTDELWLGPHAIVSDVREYEDRDGYLVGVYADHETANTSEEYATLVEALPRLVEMIQKEEWKC